VLAGLPALLEARLELALARGYDEQRDVRLCSAGDHRWDERLVSRRVEDGVSPRRGLKVSAADFDRLALGALLWRRVERPGEVPGLSAGFLRLALVFLHRALVDRPAQKEYVPAHRALPRIDMSDKDDVQMFLY
jgi:hypothetical protein